jgi:NADH:ubiquinone oxidoreductase subunit 4 (subunit M)
MNSIPIYSLIIMRYNYNKPQLLMTDLKFLIAYLSASHIALIIVAILIQTPQSYIGDTALTTAHGHTSSILFCLPNSNYE